jgi:hypothetical protein
MQTLAWETLFRAIPEELTSQLSLITRAGVEINIQNLLRIEPECIIVRGRLAASTESGRVFFIPYEQIDHIAFQKEMKEVEFAERFAPLKFPDRPTTAPATPILPVIPTPATVSETVAATIAAEGDPTANGRTAVPIKSEVLERFRNRATNGKQTPEEA